MLTFWYWAVFSERAIQPLEGPRLSTDKNILVRLFSRPVTGRPSHVLSLSLTWVLDAATAWFRAKQRSSPSDTTIKEHQLSCPDYPGTSSRQRWHGWFGIMPRAEKSHVPSCRPIHNAVVMLYVTELEWCSDEEQNPIKKEKANSGTHGQSRPVSAVQPATQKFAIYSGGLL